MIQIHWYHKNLKCQGFTIGGFYFDISFPFMTGWGTNWRRLVQIYWKTSKGRNYFFLPGCEKVTKR